MARRSAKPSWQIKIAKERIAILFEEAAKMVKKDRALANRYVELARKIGMRYNISLQREFRSKICRKCKKYLYPGITAQQRVEKGFIKVKCLSCGKINRYPYRD
jgi:ribonuclease P protein subunit RPR2